MFRGKTKKNGIWEIIELTDDDMRLIMTRVSRFNMEAFKQALLDAKELADSDIISPDNVFDVAEQLFDKLAIQTFSAATSRVNNLVEGE